MDIVRSQVLEAVAYYRGFIMDIAQLEVTDPKRWAVLRSRLLGALGRSGLENRITEIFLQHNSDGRNTYEKSNS